MNAFFAVAVLAGLSGCAGLGPLDEAERARVRAVAPAPARFAPSVEFDVPPGKAGGAMAGGAVGLLYGGTGCTVLLWPPYIVACAAMFTGAGAALGAPSTPSTKEIEGRVERRASQVGALEVQQLLTRRFAERVTRLTPLTVDTRASKHGPESPSDFPSYTGVAVGDDALVAELAVESVRVSSAGPVPQLLLTLGARLRLVRPSDGYALMTRYYSVSRYGRFMEEYEENATLLLNTIEGAVDEVAVLMVDDAFLLRADAASTAEAFAQAVEALDPLPSARCIGRAYDCWRFKRVPRLDTVSPTFRWKAFPEAGRFENLPWLRSARNLVYDLWIFGGEDNRLVEGLASIEYTLDRPLIPCIRYSWAVRARFDTDAGPRATEWSSAPGSPGSASGPATRAPVGVPFFTSCAAG